MANESVPPLDAVRLALAAAKELALFWGDVVVASAQLIEAGKSVDAANLVHSCMKMSHRPLQDFAFAHDRLVEIEQAQPKPQPAAPTQHNLN